MTIQWYEHVVKIIKYYLKQELNQPEVAIFFDSDSIEDGQPWEHSLQTGLKTSKCLVAFWTPEYFHSPWCVSEWQSFVARERVCGNEGDLILPARLHDQINFPDMAKKTQSADFSKYNSTMSYFWKSEDAYNFEKEKLKSFCKTLARKVAKAPVFQHSFPVLQSEPSEFVLDQTVSRIAKSA